MAKKNSKFKLSEDMMFIVQQGAKDLHKLNEVLRAHKEFAEMKESHLAWLLICFDRANARLYSDFQRYRIEAAGYVGLGEKEADDLFMSPAFLSAVILFCRIQNDQDWNEYITLVVLREDYQENILTRITTNDSTEREKNYEIRAKNTKEYERLGNSLKEIRSRIFPPETHKNLTMLELMVKESGGITPEDFARKYSALKYNNQYSTYPQHGHEA